MPGKQARHRDTAAIEAHVVASLDDAQELDAAGRGGGYVPPRDDRIAALNAAGTAGQRQVAAGVERPGQQGCADDDDVATSNGPVKQPVGAGAAISADADHCSAAGGDQQVGRGIRSAQFDAATREDDIATVEFGIGTNTRRRDLVDQARCGRAETHVVTGTDADQSQIPGAGGGADIPACGDVAPGDRGTGERHVAPGAAVAQRERAGRIDAEVAGRGQVGGGEAAGPRREP